jgi:hypothetical protein
MESLGLIVGHLVGDYWLQNGWISKNKANPLAGPFPGGVYGNEGGGSTLVVNSQEEFEEWEKRRVRRNLGHIACTIHCLLYTLGVWACSWWWMPWWGLLACFVAHWPVDRFAMARRWMNATSWHRDFANGPLSPWSIVVVDNTVHLLVLFVIGKCAGL